MIVNQKKAKWWTNMLEKLTDLISRPLVATVEFMNAHDTLSHLIVFGLPILVVAGMGLLYLAEK